MINIVDGAGDVETIEPGFVEGGADAIESLAREGGGHGVSVALADSRG